MAKAAQRDVRTFAGADVTRVNSGQLVQMARKTATPSPELRAAIQRAAQRRK